MQSTKKSGTGVQKSKTRPILADMGVVLLDSSLNMIASDRGAATIFNYRTASGERPGAAPAVPEEILEIVRNSMPTERAPVKAHLQLGKSGYICRAYLLLSSDQKRTTDAMIALYLERDVYADDAISDIVDKYHLTEREQEVLRGISLGLSTKELAGWMSISPNTVKAFIRLVMIKMGVTTRAGIVAKILHNGTEQAPALLEAVSPAKKHAAGRMS